MKFCLDLKYYQNKEKFKKILIETSDLPIVEYTDKDKVWGATDGGSFYIGTNALGRLLMQLRENVLNDSFELVIPEIDNLKIIGKEITYSLINSVPNNGYK